MDTRPASESRPKGAEPAPTHPQHALITTLSAPRPILEPRQNNPQDCSNLIIASVDRATVEISRTIIALNATFSQKLQQASISASNGIKAAQNSASQTISIVVQNASIATSSAFSSVTVANRAVTSANLALSSANDALTSASSQIQSVNLDLTSVSSASSSDVLRLSSSLSLAQANLFSVQASASSAIIAAQSALASASGSLAAASASAILASAISGGQPPSSSQPQTPSFEVPTTIALTPVQVAGIIVGAVLGSIVLTAAACFIFIRKSKKRRRQDSYLDEKGGSASPKILPSQSRLSSAFRTGNSIVVKYSPPPSSGASAATKKSKRRWPRDSSTAALKTKIASKQRDSSAAGSSGDDAKDSPEVASTPSSEDARPIDFEFDEKLDVLAAEVPRQSGRTSWLPLYDAKDQMDIKPTTTALASEPLPWPLGLNQGSGSTRTTQVLKEVPSSRTDTHYDGAPEKTLVVSPRIAPRNELLTTSDDKRAVKALGEKPAFEPVKVSVPPTRAPEEGLEHPITGIVERPFKELLDETLERTTPIEEALGGSSEDQFEEPIAEPTRENVQGPLSVPIMVQFDFERIEEPLKDPFKDPVAEPSEEPVEEQPHVPSKESMQQFDFNLIEEPAEKPFEEPFEEPFEDPVAEPVEEPLQIPPEVPSQRSTQQFDFEIIEKPRLDPFEDPVTELAEEPIEETSEVSRQEEPMQQLGFEMIEGNPQDVHTDPVAEPIEEIDRVLVEVPTKEAPVEEAPVEEAMDGSVGGERLELHEEGGNEVEIPPEQPADTPVEGEETKELAAHAVETPAPESPVSEVDEPLGRYSIASEIDSLLRVVSQQSDTTYDPRSSWRDSFTRTAMSPPLSQSSSPPLSRSPSPVKEASPERIDAEARALAEARERTISPLRRNPVTEFALDKTEPPPPLPPLSVLEPVLEPVLKPALEPALDERREISPLRRNPPFQQIDFLLQDNQADVGSEEPTEDTDEDDERVTRGRSMIRTSDIIEARLSAMAQQVEKERERLGEETATGRDEEAGPPPPGPAAAAAASPAAERMDRTLSPLRRNPVGRPGPPLAGGQLRPQRSSPLPATSLLRPIPTATATATATAALPRGGSPLRRDPAGPHASSPLARGAGDGRAAPATARRASNAQFSLALSRFRDLDARNPQDAVTASNEVTSRAIAGIYIPGSLREQAVRNLSKSRERGQSRMRAMGGGKRA